jgi:hypothetical protein
MSLDYLFLLYAFASLIILDIFFLISYISLLSSKFTNISPFLNSTSGFWNFEVYSIGLPIAGGIIVYITLALQHPIYSSINLLE